MKQNQEQLSGSQRRRARHPLRWCLLPLCLAMTWAGCKQQAKVAGEGSPAGTYNLVSVDGKAVPCAVDHQGHTLTIKSGLFLIHPEGTCSSRMVFSPPSGGDATREVKATYTRRGSKLTMKWEGAGTTIGTAEGNTFTMNNEGMVLSYQK